MTEAEWNACTDPQPMLEYLRGKASERKLRLFAVAWCRRVWDLLEPVGCRRAIEVSESFADAGTSAAELLAAQATAQGLVSRKMIRALPWSKAVVRRFARMAVAGVASLDVAEVLEATRFSWVITRTRASVQELTHKELTSKAHLLRCIFGNHVHATMIGRRALARSGGPVVHLAQAIYTDRTFDRLPILADALEDAGCTDPDILAHCRGPGPHVRGCWVVDLLLGRT